EGPPLQRRAERRQPQQVGAVRGHPQARSRLLLRRGRDRRGSRQAQLRGEQRAHRGHWLPSYRRTRRRHFRAGPRLPDHPPRSALQHSMKVAIDARILPGVTGGVAVAVKTLVQGLGQVVASDEQYTIIVDRVEQQAWISSFLGPNQRVVLTP